ncbi:MAG: glycosyltransferase family 2 protein [bacterium]
MNKISALVLTYNEEDRIADCLKSLSFADEIIVVDSGSTDGTLEIVRQYTPYIFNQPWLGFSGQRNFGLQKCHGEWILLLDADERIESGLALEIKEKLSHNTEYSAFYLPRKAMFLGKWIKHAGWYPDYVCRLIKNGAGYYENLVHENLVISGKAGRMKGAIVHFGHRNMNHFIEKMNQYTSLGAEGMAEKGRKAGITACLFRPLWAFFRMYILKRGFLDGTEGFVVSTYHAYNVFLKYAKLWEYNHVKK